MEEQWRLEGLLRVKEEEKKKAKDASYSEEETLTIPEEDGWRYVTYKGRLHKYNTRAQKSEIAVQAERGLSPAGSVGSTWAADSIVGEEETFTFTCGAEPEVELEAGDGKRARESPGKGGRSEKKNKTGDTDDDLVSSEEDGVSVQMDPPRTSLMEELEAAESEGSGVRRDRIAIIEEIMACEDVADGRGLNMAEGFFGELCNELMTYTAQKKSMSRVAADFIRARLVKIMKINALEIRKAERYRGFVEGFKLARGGVQEVQPTGVQEETYSFQGRCCAWCWFRECNIC